MEKIGIIAIVAVIISLFINNLIYLKKLNELFKYLRDKHPEKLSDLGIPDSLMDSSPKRILGLKRFLKSPEYFNDNTLHQLKESALIHLKIGFFGLIGGSLLLVFIYTIIGIVKVNTGQ